jgi:hypothetical protein
MDGSTLTCASFPIIFVFEWKYFFNENQPFYPPKQLLTNRQQLQQQQRLWKQYLPIGGRCRTAISTYCLVVCFMVYYCRGCFPLYLEYLSMCFVHEMGNEWYSHDQSWVSQRSLLLTSFCRRDFHSLLSCCSRQLGWYDFDSFYWHYLSILSHFICLVLLSSQGSN